MPRIVKYVTYEEKNKDGVVVEEEFFEVEQGMTEEERKVSQDSAMIHQLANPLPVEDFMTGESLEYDPEGNLIEEDGEE
jgi:hypothetical protein|tara:strand:- start:1298 stop:1534 length:237 start_codon:yes stop_codon:yes gene_type:complete